MPNQSSFFTSALSLIPSFVQKIEVVKKPDVSEKTPEKAEDLDYVHRINVSVHAFNSRLSVLKIMDAKIAFLAAFGCCSYLAGWGLGMLVLSSLLTLCIERRAEYYVSYRQAFEELKNIKQWLARNPSLLNAALAFEMGGLDMALKPLLQQDKSQPNAWMFHLYGESSRPNPLEDIMPKQILKGFDTAVNYPIPSSRP